MTSNPQSTDEPYTVQFDHGADESLTVAVAEAVATVRSEDVTELDPLHRTIDTDALDRLFPSRTDGARDGGSVTFEYNECTVTLTPGEITVRPTTD